MEKEKNIYFNERLKERNTMVEEQIKRRGIKDQIVIDAMLNVPRHLFIPGLQKKLAYQDRPLPIGKGQTISQPYIVALMTKALADLPATAKILEVGTGSGYGAAILANIFSSVHTIERHADLLEKAKEVFKKLDLNNITVHSGDATDILLEEVAFDGILVTAAAPEVPASLKKLLSIGGTMIIPVAQGSHQHLMRIKRLDQSSFEKDTICLVTFVPLVGKEGYDE